MTFKLTAAFVKGKIRGNFCPYSHQTQLHRLLISLGVLSIVITVLEVFINAECFWQDFIVDPLIIRNF